MIIEVKVPSPGESISEVEIASWLVSNGSFVEKEQEICEIDSDKATLTLVAEESGIITLLAKPNTSINVGAVICKIDTSKNKPVKRGAPVKEPQKTDPSLETKNIISAITTPSVAAKKLMNEHQIETLKGTGKSSRITKQDVLNNIKNKDSRVIKEERMSVLRRKIAQKLVSVKNETALLTTFNEIDMSAIIAIRKKVASAFKKKHNVKLGFMSFFTKAVVSALKEFPIINAQINNEKILSPEFFDIGIAVSTEKGLMVPVLRDAALMSFVDIERKIQTLSVKARDGKIQLKELSGGTFTITNGGVFGSMLSTPIINPPQSAILGIHNIVERPVVVNGKIAIRSIMYVALSYDHRIIDGKDSVKFLVTVKNCLENPVNELMGGSIKKGLQL